MLASFFNLLKGLLVVVCVFVSSILMAQPGDPGGGGDPDVPIDGGIGFLLAAGALYGAKRIYDVKRNKR